jgi:hypothetical protein
MGCAIRRPGGGFCCCEEEAWVVSEVVGAGSWR